MKPAVTFDDYQTISDSLLYLGSSIWLKMNIKLANKEQDGFISSSIIEYPYQINAPNRNMGISVKRRFFPYLSIEYKDESSKYGKGMIQINHFNILGLRAKINEVEQKLNSCFGKRKNDIVITSNFVIESILDDNHSIRFSPIIYNYDDNEKSTGISMCFDNRVSIDIPIRIWKAFCYYITTADLYGWGATILSGYTQDTIGNYIQYMNGSSQDSISESSGNTNLNNSSINRKPINNKKGNFFDNK